MEIIHKLSKAAEHKDNETGKHIERVSHYVELIGREYGLDSYECDLLMNAASMHDIGKLGIADSILQKPGKLNPEEFEIMKTHSQIGADILGENKSDILNVARYIALEHHEKWDGSGYPLGKKGNEISIYARITAIADVYDALMSKRPYKEPWPTKDAIDWIMAQKGLHFDPKVVDAFNNVIEQIIEIGNKLKD